jgi:hypothetical protein
MLVAQKCKVDQLDQCGQVLVDQNLKASSFSNENRWAGSLVRIGRRPPKPVVVGSNPTPPAVTGPYPRFRRLREVLAGKSVKSR